MESKEKPWWVYIVECSDGSLYTGITVNVENRVLVHNSGKGAKYTKTRIPVNLRVSWLFENRSAAAKEECRIKQLSRSQKLLLLNDK